jgi:hypothetical protein
MSTELKWLIGSIFTLTFTGLATIIAILYLRPHDDNVQIISTIISFLLPTILAFIAAFKGMQNSNTLTELKVQGDGHLAQAVKQAAAVASLTEQVAGVKTAAVLAAKTAEDTAIALAAKKETE